MTRSSSVLAPPGPGDRAPVVSLHLADGRMIRNDAFEGRPYLLYFYPKADTPGCTTQACDLRDAQESSFQTSAQIGSQIHSLAGLTVIGVSPDPIDRLQAFDRKYTLGFPLASDEDHTVAEAYGTWVEKSMYGRTYMGMERSSFLVDGQGVVRFVWRKVKPADHARLVADALSQIA